MDKDIHYSESLERCHRHSHSPKTKLMAPSSDPFTLSIHTSVAALLSRHHYFYVSFSLLDNELPKGKNCVSSVYRKNSRAAC